MNSSKMTGALAVFLFLISAPMANRSEVPSARLKLQKERVWNMSPYIGSRPNNRQEPRSNIELHDPSAFDDDQQFDVLKKKILYSGSFVTVEKQQKDFQETDLDTFANTRAAARVVKTRYPDVIAEEDAVRRVIALYFLRYTKNLEQEECLSLLDSLALQHKFAPSEGHRRAIKFDMGSVSYACARFSSDRFSERVEALHSLELVAQCQMAMTVYAEDVSKGDGL